MDFHGMTDEQLIDLHVEILNEQRLRLYEVLTTQKNVKVVTLRAGFSGPEGRVVYSLGIVNYEDHVLCFCFSDEPDGNTRWLIEDDPIKLYDAVRLLKDGESVESNWRTLYERKETR